MYLQYSNRQEIINARNTADTPSNVLLVSLENLLVRSRHPHNTYEASLVVALSIVRVELVHKASCLSKQLSFQAVVVDRMKDLGF